MTPRILATAPHLLCSASLRLHVLSICAQAATQLPGRRQPASHEIRISLGALTARAAFSHVPFWQSTAGMVAGILLRPVPGNPAAPPLKAAVVEVGAQTMHRRGQIIAANIATQRVLGLPLSRNVEPRF